MRTGALREDIEEAVRAGDSLEDIELDILEHVQLRDEARDALWLYAWGRLEQERDTALA